MPRNVRSGPTIQNHLKNKTQPPRFIGPGRDSVLRAGARFGTRNVIDSFRASAGAGASGGQAHRRMRCQLRCSRLIVTTWAAGTCAEVPLTVR